MNLKTNQIAEIAGIITIIPNEMTPFDLKNEMDLRNDLNFDSLDIVELTIELEKKFLISIGTSDYENWKTVKDVLETVDKILYP